MSSVASVPPPQKLTFTHWLILFIASIGFAFDIYELLMLPLVLRPALDQLGGIRPGTDAFNIWLGVMFYVPALVGGVFGLLGGYLTDALGRRRILTWSILLYAVSAFLAGFSTNLYILLFLRCTTFIGVCVEFVAAVAWLSELFPNPEQRERVLGYTQAFSSVGGLLIAVANGIAFDLDRGGLLPVLQLPAFLASSFGQIPIPSATPPYGVEWRYTLMSGLIPAIPLILIRPFLPESPAWQEKKLAGILRRPNPLQLFSAPFLRTTLVTTVMVACAYGAAFGAIQQIPQIVPGLQDVQEHVQGKTVPQKKAYERMVATEYVKVQELGGLLGRFLLAILAVRIVSRRNLVRVFQVPGLLFMPAFFALFLFMPNIHFFEINLSAIYLGRLPITTVSLGVMLCGLLTVAQFSFWGNYLPLVYPVHLRGTGESVAANIGGRMVGTSFAAVTSFCAWLIGRLPESDFSAPVRFAYAAAAVALFVYAVGLIFSFLLPEPPREELLE